MGNFYRRLVWLWFCDRHEHLRRHHHSHPHRHHFYIVLFVNGVGVILKPGQMEKLMFTLTLGHTLEISLQQLDTNGNPMLTPVPADSPPSWSNTTPATETIAAAADGLSAEGTLLAAGTDVVNGSGSFGGKSFSWSVSVEVDPAPQVLGSVVAVPSASA